MLDLVNFGIQEQHGKPVVSSRIVAEVFGKEHRNVLRDIKDIIGGMLKIEQPPTDYFHNSTYVHPQNKDEYPEFLLTKNGFVLLTMGYNGDAALKFKISYIKKFDEMESELRMHEIIRAVSIATRKELTDVIQELGINEKMHGHAFSNYTNLAYRAVLGMDAKKFKELNGIDPKANIRDCLNSFQLKMLEKVEKLVSTLLENGYEYSQVKMIILEPALISGKKTA